jgi:Prion-inhibition and propagation
MSGFEVFGAVGGVGALAGVSTSCVDCFKYVQLGKSFDDDFQKAQVRLDNQALRLAK